MKRDAVPSLSVPNRIVVRRNVGVETTDQALQTSSTTTTEESEDMPATTAPVFCPIAAVPVDTEIVIDDGPTVVLNEEIVVSSDLGTEGEILLLHRVELLLIFFISSRYSYKKNIFCYVNL